MGILIGVFSAAIFMDWRYYRIPNVCIAAGTAAGMAQAYMSESWRGVAAAAVCAGIIFLVFYPFYILGGLGAGDIKLFMMTGCYIRDDALIQYMLVTMAIAGIWSLLKMAVYAESRGRLLYLVRYIRKAVLTGAVDEYQIDKTQKRCVIRLSIPAFASLLLMQAGIL